MFIFRIVLHKFVDIKTSQYDTRRIIAFNFKER